MLWGKALISLLVNKKELFLYYGLPKSWDFLLVANFLAIKISFKEETSLCLVKTMFLNSEIYYLFNHKDASRSTYNGSLLI